MFFGGLGAASAFSAASLTSRSTSASSAFNSSSVASVLVLRNSLNRAIGSRRDSASRSAAGLYSFSSSDSECEYGRMTRACTNAGPLRARTWAVASRIARRLAKKSVPSIEST